MTIVECDRVEVMERTAQPVLRLCWETWYNVVGNNGVDIDSHATVHTSEGGRNNKCVCLLLDDATIYGYRYRMSSTPGRRPYPPRRCDVRPVRDQEDGRIHFISGLWELEFRQGRPPAIHYDIRYDTIRYDTI